MPSARQPAAAQRRVPDPSFSFPRGHPSLLPFARVEEELQNPDLGGGAVFKAHLLTGTKSPQRPSQLSPPGWQTGMPPSEAGDPGGAMASAVAYGLAYSPESPALGMTPDFPNLENKEGLLYSL